MFNPCVVGTASVDGNGLRSRIREHPVGMNVRIGLYMNQLLARLGGVIQRHGRVETGFNEHVSLSRAFMSCEDEIGSTREIFDDLGGLGVPAQPDDFLVLGLRNDVGLFPAHVPQEGIGVIVGHVDTRSVRDAQHSVVSVAPDWSTMRGPMSTWPRLISAGPFATFSLSEMVCLRAGSGGMVGEAWAGWDRVAPVASAMNMADKAASGRLIMDASTVGLIPSTWLGSRHRIS